jgi:alkyl sulfatase BDS1-like metallo-beta-lactamase superfamily hydrolase
MPHSVLAVEAPLYDEYTRGALVQVNEAFPGKPLTSVVATHFHYDHIGGIRGG